MLRKSIILISFLSLFLLAGCADHSDRLETGGLERIHAQLDPAQAVLVTTPKDGGSGDKTYRGSGAATAQRIDAALSRYARLVDVTPVEYRNWDALQPILLEKPSGYVVVPTILDWQRHDQHWSNKPSSASIKIVVMDGTSGKDIASTIITAKIPPASDGMLGFGLTNVFDKNTDNPEELLTPALNAYIDQLYRDRGSGWTIR